MKYIANILTLSRVFIVFPVAILVLYPSPIGLIISLFLVILSYITDVFDGFFARKYKQDSSFGAILDIACDRVQEFSYWLIFISSGALPLVVGVIAFAREIMTDTIRHKVSSDHKESLISVVSNPISRMIVTSRVSRAINGLVKIVTFSLANLYLLSHYYFDSYSSLIFSLAQIMAWITALVILIRGVMIIIDLYPRLNEK